LRTVGVREKEEEEQSMLREHYIWFREVKKGQEFAGLQLSRGGSK
jgi:uncharacterized protein YnzC (UPF0291/DUF896 family)